MVRRKGSLRRFAFTMIELIFAIVIIGISVLSLPMMISTTNKGIESNIIQEAIFAASAELMGATTGYWDENSMEDINVSQLSRVIDIDGTCNNDSSSIRFRLRPGHIAQPFHRRCLDSNTTLANNSAVDLADINVTDLDNAKHAAVDIFINTITDEAGYKDSYQSKIDVNSSVADGNIKIITATITDSSGKIVTKLTTQCANIGEVDYYRRMF